MKPRIALLCLVLWSGSVVAKDEQPVLKDNGLDGESRHYAVTCPNGDRPSLDHKYKIGEICIYPMEGEAFCIKEDDPDKAAVRACRGR